LVGVASTSPPTELYRNDHGHQLALQALSSAAMLAACLFTVYFVTMRYVIRPLSKVETAVSEIGAGNFQARINPDSVHAHDEMKSLSEHVNEMAEELDSLHQNLEDKIAQRTEQLAEANSMLVKQAEELENVNQQLQADDRYKSHYFTMMSHELRTPLTAIRAYIDILKDSSCDHEQKADMLEMIQANTISLSKLVNNILDSARLEAGAVKLEISTVDATDLINELARTLEPLARAKCIDLKRRADGEVPLFLADENKLMHILENLGSNAIKYSTEGGRVLIRVYHDKPTDTIRFDVIDNGSGIPEDEQQMVFEKFRQTESSMSRPVSGSGLGLALAKEYTELHGGTILVRSKPGEGSIFTVCLPYRKPDFELEWEEAQ
ncbi:sensor histidine kinase KdpD, partial [uncultured Slackia sp.]|uniref:sensor histidine kinase n=1 Tax=uncultured Slackia sp. TaxID=665903 RepID=UPI0025F0D923